MSRKIIELIDKPIEPIKSLYYVDVFCIDNPISAGDVDYVDNVSDVLERFASVGITDPSKILFQFEESTDRWGENQEIICRFYYLKEEEWDKDINKYTFALKNYETWLVEKSDKIKREKARQKQERKEAKEGQKKRRLAKEIEKKKQELARLQNQTGSF